MPIYLHIEHNISHNVTLHLCFALLCSIKKFVQNTYMKSKLRFKPEKIDIQQRSLAKQKQ